MRWLSLLGLACRSRYGTLRDVFFPALLAVRLHSAGVLGEGFTLITSCAAPSSRQETLHFGTFISKYLCEVNSFTALLARIMVIWIYQTAGSLFAPTSSVRLLDGMGCCDTAYGLSWKPLSDHYEATTNQVVIGKKKKRNFCNSFYSERKSCLVFRHQCGFLKVSTREMQVRSNTMLLKTNWTPPVFSLHLCLNDSPRYALHEVEVWGIEFDVRSTTAVWPKSCSSNASFPNTYLL